jgi:hypothetical protein
MSARKIDSLSPVNAQSAQTRLSLSANEIRVRKNGIEFHSSSPLAAWKEMTLDLQSPQGKKIHCTGVVVACSGNRHAGYNVSVLFTNISKHSQELLSALVSSRLN